MSRTYLLKMENNLIRIQKYFTDCGILSRRAAEAAIEAGEVSVNGERATIGQKIDTKSDIIKYRGRIIRPTYKEYSYFMLNKPRGFITSLSDEKGRKCVTELLHGVKERVYPVGRLDYNTEGLIFLTNDGDLAYSLTHPKYEKEKVYEVLVKGIVLHGAIDKLVRGVYIDGKKTAPAQAEVVEHRRNTSLVRICIHEGRNRQIRKMCDAVGHSVIALRRVAVDGIEIGNLEVGRWRHLTRTEVERLRR